MGFLQVISHLLPRGAAWRVTKTSKALRKLFAGAAPTLDAARTALDQPYAQISPEATTEIAEWERQYGIEPSASDPTRRLVLAAEWRATGGQSPSYIQDVLQTAGFAVYIHEWWASGPPSYVARDPHTYTNVPEVGTVQCVGDAYRMTYGAQPQCSDGRPDFMDRLIRQFQCDAFLVNDPHYLVNKLLTQVAPPPIPNDPNVYPFFFYVGGAIFPNHATIPSNRRAEFERLLLKLRPLQHWIVTLIDYDITPPASPFYFDGGDGFDGGYWA